MKCFVCSLRAVCNSRKGRLSQAICCGRALQLILPAMVQHTSACPSHIRLLIDRSSSLDPGFFFVQRDPPGLTAPIYAISVTPTGHGDQPSRFLHGHHQLVVTLRAIPKVPSTQGYLSISYLTFALPRCSPAGAVRGNAT